MLFQHILAHPAFLMMSAHTRTSDNDGSFLRKLNDIRRLSPGKGNKHSPVVQTNPNSVASFEVGVWNYEQPIQPNPSIDTPFEVGVWDSGQQVAPRTHENEAPFEIGVWRPGQQVVPRTHESEAPFEIAQRTQIGDPSLQSTSTGGASFNPDVGNLDPPPLQGTSTDGASFNSHIWNPNTPTHSTDVGYWSYTSDEWSNDYPSLQSGSSDDEVFFTSEQNVHQPATWFNTNEWNRNRFASQSSNTNSALFTTDESSTDYQSVQSTDSDDWYSAYNTGDQQSHQLVAQSSNTDGALFNTDELSTDDLWYRAYNTGDRQSHQLVAESSDTDGAWFDTHKWINFAPGSQSSDTHNWSVSSDESDTVHPSSLRSTGFHERVHNILHTDARQVRQPAAQSPSTGGASWNTNVRNTKHAHRRHQRTRSRSALDNINADSVFYSDPYVARDFSPPRMGLTFTIELTEVGQEFDKQHDMTAGDLRNDLKLVFKSSKIDVPKGALTVQKARWLYFKCTIQCKSIAHKQILEDHLIQTSFIIRYNSW
eukprot:GEMP01010903.1.p1 GENE.GEMP01010903.1~~GEMP01010903.1.p1  ORF type:complete len:558 (+),score=79.95 GEMP01010903.1:64-1674(+)